MPEVLRYVKNDRLGFEVPYEHGGEEHQLSPRLHRRAGRRALALQNPLHLVLEVKGERDARDDAKHETMPLLFGFPPSITRVVTGAGAFFNSTVRMAPPMRSVPIWWIRPRPPVPFALTAA